MARDPDIQAARVLLLGGTALRLSTPTPGSRRLQSTTHARTVASLFDKVLTGGSNGYASDMYTLTPEAVLVRAVGVADEDKQAKRRYAKRLRAETASAP